MVKPPARVLIIGGYGAFGSLIAERLAREADLDLVIAGRSTERADAAVAKLRSAGKASLSSAVADATTLTAAEIRALAPRVVINTAGPYQAQDYTLARACIAAGCHYIDLADARAFVTGITALDAEANAAGVSVISGASSVPGLSSAVYLALKRRFASVDTLEIFLSPGNHFNPGEATTRSVLGGAGRPMTMQENGRTVTVYGWQGLRRRKIEGIGTRWFGYVDVPDLDLFPAADANLKTVRFQAGVEVSVFHLGLWALAGLKRARLLNDVAALTRPLMRLKEALAFLGTDRGGMLMTLAGTSLDGKPLRLNWSLAATHGHGPYIPTIASIILTKRLVRAGTPLPTGAMPCFGLFTLDEFLAEVSDLQITSATIAQ
ncbi:MAG: saccharopine dehydrogenase NADP-binding domain-containing protein [Hyphomicrobiaceae bacterium]|nr:saccharopine dehydrogenase NADP-binding domain-containing protein [Hyphomicrobiaceae bacterium]